MILLDANLLIYAHDVDSPRHAAARTWLDEQLTRRIRVGLPWHSALAFVRIIANKRIYPNPRPIRESWAQVQRWLAWPSVWIPAPGELHASILGPLLDTMESEAGLVSDAHLAALAIEHGLTLCTTDKDFARFPGLDWQNPLA